jgi:putative DNA modification/repair radical SAM protein
MPGHLEIQDKLALLADAAKYDASCASSGGERRGSRAGGLGSSTGNGICHSYTPDGRCVSLLKILLTNACVYDCAYCVNRRSSNVRRARFTEREVVDLTLAFYKRNYIEGLFLSSGIIRSPDYTMERLVRVARTLREAHGFKGYIHLKTIPEASPELIEEAGRHADRLSINVELPSAESLARLAPEKSVGSIHQSMGRLRHGIDARRAPSRAGRASRPPGRARSSSSAPTPPPTPRSSPTARGCTTGSACGGCTTPRSARFRTPAAGYPPSRRRCSARTGCTKRTG